MQQGRRELALVALRQYEQKGFAQTTVEEIAAAADYAPSSFFRHFGTKENAVFFDIDERMMSYQALLDAESVPTESAWARVCEVLLENATYWVESDPEFALARTRLCHQEPALYARYLQYCDQVEGLLRQVLAGGRGAEPGNDIEAGVMAGCAVAAFRTALRVWLTEGGRVVDHLKVGLDALQGGLPPRQQN